ncbi:MAG: sigma-70 family RNA polymerase sigma factor [Candidatus Gastranaerophilales bacterium]|nr:sigma-70 family RNA polymerase sigma factor [Candidatus Gastranaerophilales bacterium]
MVSTYPNKITKIKSSLKCYDDIVYTVARIEYSRLNGSHVMEFPELLAIGRIVINDLLEDEAHEYNVSYMSTAIKWAIRNELRRRYKWYTAKEDSSEEKDNRECLYTTILSINELQEQENPVQIVDHSITPDQKCEVDDLNVLIKKSIKKLPQRERSIIESRFYNDKRIKEIAEEFNISPSRISRIIQAGLDKIKKDLKKQEIFC